MENEYEPLITKALEEFQRKTMAAFSQTGRFVADQALREAASALVQAVVEKLVDEYWQEMGASPTVAEYHNLTLVGVSNHPGTEEREGGFYDGRADEIPD